MKLKVCGIKFPGNMMDVAQLKPDFMGFIFHPASRRFMEKTLRPKDVGALPDAIKKVGVFVDADPGRVGEQVHRYALDLVQLHGGETPEVCQTIRDMGVGVIKAFGVSPEWKAASVLPYTPVCDYFLFDTATKAHGGSGRLFNWSLLQDANIQRPYFLSGGLSPEIISGAQWPKPQPFGIDINSRVETEPGVKDIERINPVNNLIKRIHGTSTV